MPQLYIDTALRLPAPDIEALIQGQSIAAMPRTFLDPGRVFALYPSDVSNNPLPIEQHYRTNFLTLAKNTISQLHPEAVMIRSWAKCEFCEIVDKSKSLEALSPLTIWTTETLHKILDQRPYIFLAFLRVYLLPEAVVMPVITQGQFVALPKSVSVTDNKPVLTNIAFSQCRHLLENRLPPLNSVDGVDELLGWLKNLPVERTDPDWEWIKTIGKIGNSSDGQTFEKLVRKGLIKLGFSNSSSNPKASLDPDATGGAGGLDFYCEAPYPVVGECKASSLKKIPTPVCAQLTYLAQTHLSQEEYERSIRIIIGVGSLNEYSSNVAKGNKMNIIRPETLQKLIEKKANYPGSINLLELKVYLENAPFGEDADTKVNNYINNIEESIKLRSHIVEAVKQLCKPGKEYPIVAEICTLYNAKFAEGDRFELDKKSVYELLLELSSPLTGYLGRKKGSDGSDRFYYLRDLIVNTEQKQ